MNDKMVLLIPIQNGIKLVDIEKYLKTEFISKDHMIGFFEGYLFDKFRVLTLFEYEIKLNSYSLYLKDKWVKFITIKGENNES